MEETTIGDEPFGVMDDGCNIGGAATYEHRKNVNDCICYL